MHRNVMEHTKKQNKQWDIHPHWAVQYLHFTFSIEPISKMCRKEETCKTTVKKKTAWILSLALSQAVSEAASFPGLCVPQHVKRVDYWNSMAKVIHAKRTTAWTVQASTQTKIPSNLRLCASREMIGTEKGGAERLLQTAQAQQTQQKKKGLPRQSWFLFPYVWPTLWPPMCIYKRRICKQTGHALFPVLIISHLFKYFYHWKVEDFHLKLTTIAWISEAVLTTR